MSSSVPSVTSPPWSATTKRLVALAVIVVFFLFARQVDAAPWTGIIISVVLAYLLSPVVTFFEQRLRIVRAFEVRRTLAVVLTWLAVVGVIALGIGLVVPAMSAQLRQFADDLPTLAADTEADLRAVLDRPITIGRTTIVPWQELERTFAGTGEDGERTTLTASLQDAVLSLADPALGLVGGAVTFVFTLFFVLVMLFYLMRDGPLFVEYLVEVVPDSYRGDVRRLLHELGLVWNAYLRGQLLLCLVIGVATYINALILGLPQPLLLAMVAGSLEFIPNLGPAIAQMPALLFALTTDSATIPSLDAGLIYAVVVSLSYIVIQNLEAVFLVPRILGHSLDLHPFVVLVSILIGANLYGVLGVVLAAPTAATLRLLLRYLRGKLLDEETFPAGPGYAATRGGLLRVLIRYFLGRRYPVLAPEGVENSARAVVEDADAALDDAPERSPWLRG